MLELIATSSSRQRNESGDSAPITSVAHKNGINQAQTKKPIRGDITARRAIEIRRHKNSADNSSVAETAKKSKSR